jgi:hypothetical protein
MTPKGSLRYGPLQVVFLAVAVVWAWFASGVRTFTRPAEVLAAVPIVVVLVLTLRPSARLPAPAQRSQEPASLRGIIPWVAAVIVLVGWELSELFSKPRSTHPTLSSIMNDLLSTRPTRFIGYLVWLALGWLMVRRLGSRHE